MYPPEEYALILLLLLLLVADEIQTCSPKHVGHTYYYCRATAVLLKVSYHTLHLFNSIYTTHKGDALRLLCCLYRYDIQDVVAIVVRRLRLTCLVLLSFHVLVGIHMLPPTYIYTKYIYRERGMKGKKEKEKKTTHASASVSLRLVSIHQNSSAHTAPLRSAPHLISPHQHKTHIIRHSLTMTVSGSSHAMRCSCSAIDFL